MVGIGDEDTHLRLLRRALGDTVAGVGVTDVDDVANSTRGALIAGLGLHQIDQCFREGQEDLFAPELLGALLLSDPDDSDRPRSCPTGLKSAGHLFGKDLTPTQAPPTKRSSFVLAQMLLLGVDR